MSSLAISDVPWLSKRIKACCRRAKLFSTHELLLAPPLHLQQALRLTPPEVELLLLQVATAAKAPTVLCSMRSMALRRPPLADDLFGEHRDDSSDSHTDDEPIHDDPRLVPPTQGYDGNFPGAHSSYTTRKTTMTTTTTAAPDSTTMMPNPRGHSTRTTPRVARFRAGAHSRRTGARPRTPRLHHRLTRARRAAFGRSALLITHRDRRRERIRENADRHPGVRLCRARPHPTRILIPHLRPKEVSTTAWVCATSPRVASEPRTASSRARCN